MPKDALDQWFPVIIRYVGLVLGVILVLAPILTDVTVAEVAGGYPFATGCILYKTVKEAVEGGKKD